MAVALAFYRDLLGFEVERDGADEGNAALVRGDARIMLETPTGFYSPGYNAAIEERLGSMSAIALYLEATDLDDLYRRVTDAGVTIVRSARRARLGPAGVHDRGSPRTVADLLARDRRPGGLNEPSSAASLRRPCLTRGRHLLLGWVQLLSHSSPTSQTSLERTCPG